jgi:hypothetical protein
MHRRILPIHKVAEICHCLYIAQILCRSWLNAMATFFSALTEHASAVVHSTQWPTSRPLSSATHPAQCRTQAVHLHHRIHHHYRQIGSPECVSALVETGSQANNSLRDFGERRFKSPPSATSGQQDVVWPLSGKHRGQAVQGSLKCTAMPPGSRGIPRSAFHMPC